MSFTSKEFLYPLSLGIAIGLGVSALYACKCHQKCESNDKKYTIADQPKRFALAKEANNRRVLDIDSLYDPSHVKGKTVLVTGNFFFQTFQSVCCN